MSELKGKISGGGSVRGSLLTIPRIVNDLTTGGTSMALSAEMGKALNEKVEGLTASDVDARPNTWIPTLAEVGGSNPNLLDNSYFADPIDQRGGYVVPPNVGYYTLDWSTMVGTTATYYPVKRRVQGVNLDGTIEIGGVEYLVAHDQLVRGYVGAGYTIDRWKMVGDSAAVVLDREFITLHGNSSGAYWLQYIENKELYAGKMCTFSVLYSDNVFHTVSGVITEGSSLTLTGAPGGWDAVTLDSNNLYAQHSANAGRTKSVVATKLEVGTEQTLAHQDADGNWILNEIPDYNEQLLRCCMSKADSSDTYANNKRTPAAINAVNKAGDTMTGDLTVTHPTGRGSLSVKDARYERRAQIEQNTDRTWFNNILDGANYSSVVLRPETEALTERLQLVEKINNSQNRYNILHTGNKPSGSYTGNGSATTRPIKTGGTGSMLIISAVNSIALINEWGGVVFHFATQAMVSYTHEAVNYQNGTLTLNTAVVGLNGNGYEHTYYSP